MFSALANGRLGARALLGGLSQTDPRAGGGGDYGLGTAGCGFGKDFRQGLLEKGVCYGDDACLVARHRSADVLGILISVETSSEKQVSKMKRINFELSMKIRQLESNHSVKEQEIERHNKLLKDR